MADPNDNLIVPTFKTHSVYNEAVSKEKGRAVYDDMEVVEIRMAGNKQTIGVFPAHEVWKIVDHPGGAREPTTYAMRWPDQYRRFKENTAQVQSGTPLEEAPFIPQGKRFELKALNIHTLEALAALDGQNLKMLGMNGREMKNQAQAFLDKASGTAVETRLASENEQLRQQLADLQEQFNRFSAGSVRLPAEPVDPPVGEPAEDGDDDAQHGAGGAPSPFQDWEDADIKNWIEEQQGSKPKGNPNHETLVRLADEVNAELAKKAQGN